MGSIKIILCLNNSKILDNSENPEFKLVSVGTAPLSPSVVSFKIFVSARMATAPPKICTQFQIEKKSHLSFHVTADFWNTNADNENILTKAVGQIIPNNPVLVFETSSSRNGGGAVSEHQTYLPP